MPIYEYECPGTDGANQPHVFEKIVPMSDFEKTQTCAEHHKECPRIPFSPNAPWVWGYEEVHWTAGTSQNPTGMNHAKTHQTLHKEKK